MPTTRGQNLLALAALAALLGSGGAVPGAAAKKRLANSSAAGAGYTAGLLDLTNSTLWQYDDLATAHIHYAAGVLGNSTKKRVDYVLPKLSVAAKHYGWVNKSTPLPANAAELAQYGKDTARPYLKSYLQSTLPHAKGKARSDAWEDEMLDKAGEVFWSVWLPRLVKLCLVLGLCCLCGGVLYWANRQPPKDGHQS